MKTSSLVSCAAAGLLLGSSAFAQTSASKQRPAATPSAQPTATPSATVLEAQPTLAPGFGTPSKLIEDFFGHLKTNSVDAAYTSLLRGSKIAESKEDVATLKNKTLEALRAFGDIHSFDLISTKQVGGHLFSATYIAAAKNYPIRWRFFFYKATDVWKLVDIRIDDRLNRMFDEVEPTASAASADSGQ